MRLDECSRLFLIIAANLTDHDDAVCIRVCLKHPQAIVKSHAVNRITTDTHTGTLAKTTATGLKHGLVGQRAGTRHDADMAGGMHGAWHDTDLAGAWRNDAGTVRTDQQGFGLAQYRLDAHHVEHRNTLGDTHNQSNTGSGRLQYRVRGKGRWNIDHGGLGTGRADSLGHGIEYRQIEMCLAAFARGYTADDIGAVFDGFFGMKAGMLAGKALVDDS